MFNLNQMPSLQALDTFNTAVVSPVYYVMFTSLTILASMIMFKVIKKRKKKRIDRVYGDSIHSIHLCFELYASLRQKNTVVLR